MNAHWVVLLCLCACLRVTPATKFSFAGSSQVSNRLAFAKSEECGAALNSWRKWQRFEEVLSFEGLSFIHVFKSGGSSVQHALGSLYLDYWRKLEYISFRHAHDLSQNDIDAMRNSFCFAFVRDPLRRVLSWFSEWSLRGNGPAYNCKVQRIGALQCLRKTLAAMKGRLQMADGNTANGWLPFDSQTTATAHVEFVFGDSHAWPQTVFVANKNGTLFDALSFIGDMQQINAVLPQIVSRFLAVPISELKSKMQLAKPMRGPIAGEENWAKHLTVQMLSAEDIRNVCDLYKVDYICLGFELPKECDGLF